MAKAGVVSAACYCAAGSLFYSRHWPNHRAGAVVFVQRPMLAIQYCDYPFDNHKVPFKTMRAALRTQKVANMQFGALTSLFTMIPVLNLFIMPVAVCGATAMWVDCWRAKHALWK